MLKELIASRCDLYALSYLSTDGVHILVGFSDLLGLGEALTGQLSLFLSLIEASQIICCHGYLRLIRRPAHLRRQPTTDGKGLLIQLLRFRRFAGAAIKNRQRALSISDPY